jgi:Protein of unknown function (DUF1566)
MSRYTESAICLGLITCLDLRPAPVCVAAACQVPCATCWLGLARRRATPRQTCTGIANQFLSNLFMKQTTFITAAALFFSSPSTASPPFSVSSNGHEVLDSSTQLVWRRCAEGMTWNGLYCAGKALTFTHRSALQRAMAQSLVTDTAWRVPSLKELLSVADPTNLQISAVDASVFSNFPPQRFWTSSAFMRYTSANASSPRHAQYVDFSNGGYLYAPVKRMHALVLVRDKL